MNWIAAYLLCQHALIQFKEEEEEYRCYFTPNKRASFSLRESVVSLLVHYRSTFTQLPTWLQSPQTSFSVVLGISVSRCHVRRLGETEQGLFTVPQDIWNELTFSSVYIPATLPGSVRARFPAGRMNRECVLCLFDSEEPEKWIDSEAFKTHWVGLQKAARRQDGVQAQQMAVTRRAAGPRATEPPHTRVTRLFKADAVQNNIIYTEIYFFLSAQHRVRRSSIDNINHHQRLHQAGCLLFLWSVTGGSIRSVHSQKSHQYKNQSNLIKVK